MSTTIQLPPVRPNPYLRWMAIVGVVLFAVGLLIGLIGYSALERADINLLDNADGWIRAQADLAAGASIAGYGLLLLMIAWIIAAAKHR